MRDSAQKSTAIVKKNRRSRHGEEVLLGTKDYRDLFKQAGVRSASLFRDLHWNSQKFGDVAGCPLGAVRAKAS